MSDEFFENILFSLSHCKYPISSMYHVNIIIPEIIFFKNGNPDVWFSLDKVFLNICYAKKRGAIYCRSDEEAKELDVIEKYLNTLVENDLEGEDFISYLKLNKSQVLA